MKNVTLAQGNQVLNLILQKDVPREQIQDLLASGLLADLLDANVQQVDRKKFREVLGLSAFKYDKTKDGWKLFEDVTFDWKQFVPKFVEFLKSGEPCIDGEEMKRRALKLNANSGQHDAEYLLENQKLIPKELRVKCLIFPGTVWQDNLGDRRCVPCLFWGGNEWYMSFRYLALSLDENDRLVSSHE